MTPRMDFSLSASIRSSQRLRWISAMEPSSKANEDRERDREAEGGGRAQGGGGNGGWREGENEEGEARAEVKERWATCRRHAAELVRGKTEEGGGRGGGGGEGVRAAVKVGRSSPPFPRLAFTSTSAHDRRRSKAFRRRSTQSNDEVDVSHRGGGGGGMTLGIPLRPQSEQAVTRQLLQSLV